MGEALLNFAHYIFTQKQLLLRSIIQASFKTIRVWPLTPAPRFRLLLQCPSHLFILQKQCRRPRKEGSLLCLHLSSCLQRNQIQGKEKQNFCCGDWNKPHQDPSRDGCFLSGVSQMPPSTPSLWVMTWNLGLKRWMAVGFLYFRTLGSPEIGWHITN